MNPDKMTVYLSDKLKVISFICIVLVVWIHTYYIEGLKYTSTTFFMNFWGSGVCSIAVPMFYIISGYLFFINTEYKGIKSIFVKQKRRVRTLLIPYVCANIVSIIFYSVLKFCCVWVPMLYNVINTNLLDKVQGNIFYRIYYYMWEGPIAFHMWFVRDLMIIILFTPIIYYVLRLLMINLYLTGLGIIACLFLIYCHNDPFSWSCGWFILGGLFAMSNRINVMRTQAVYTIGILSTICALGISFINAMYTIKVNTLYINSNFITIMGVPGFWICYDLIVKRRIFCVNDKLKLAFNSTFFIYLIHEPFLNIFKKLPFLFGQSSYCLNISYFIIPIVFITVCIYIGNILKNKIPNLYRIYTGGR